MALINDHSSLPLAYSTVLCNDSQMRCNFVDLYYSLYGSKRPKVLMGPEPSSSVLSLPKIPKLSERRSASPIVPSIVEAPIRVPTPDIKIEEEVVVMAEEPAAATELKTEIVEVPPEPIEIKVERDEELPKPPELKRIKTDFQSDNSVSLPGIQPGTSGPTGFEPGMFSATDSVSDKDKSKDKDKDKDGQSKVMHSFIFRANQRYSFLIFTICRRKRRKKRRNTSISTSTSITRIRIRIRIVTKIRRTRKIQIYHDCWSKKIHQKPLARRTHRATAIRRLQN